jgi:serine/threonine protein kinase
LKGQNNHIVDLIDAIRDTDQNNATLVYSYMNSTTLDTKGYYNKYSLDEIKTYMHQLFKAVNESHYGGIIHRDIKL